jgi:GntR family transcriptional regulator, transcriptional repressor for pyruvate dehydrogenase complex
MTLYAINDRSLADQVFDQLVGEIMAERYPSGASLPSERNLTEIFGVNRHVVREAIKRLEQLGLLKTSRGGSTKVLDFKRNAGLDLLAMMTEYARGEDVARYSLAVLEMRAAIGADIVRLCAEHAAPELRKDLVSIAREMREATSDEHLFAIEVRFWDRILDGADNIAYRLAFNSLIKGTLAMGRATQSCFVAEIRATDSRLPIAEAILAGDAEKAEAITRAAMRRSTELFTNARGRRATTETAAVSSKTLRTAVRRESGLRTNGRVEKAAPLRRRAQ